MPSEDRQTRLRMRSCIFTYINTHIHTLNMFGVFTRCEGTGYCVYIQTYIHLYVHVCMCEYMGLGTHFCLQVSIILILPHALGTTPAPIGQRGLTQAHTCKAKPAQARGAVQGLDLVISARVTLLGLLCCLFLFWFLRTHCEELALSFSAVSYMRFSRARDLALCTVYMLM
jgi:hypothetical protein